MNATQLIALGQQICDDIANNVDGLAPDIRSFDWLGLDMTESYVKRWNDAGRVERAPVMQRQAGQKVSERMLWTVGPVSKDKVVSLQAIERQEELERLTRAYSPYVSHPSYSTDPRKVPDGYELDVDYVTFATGLAKAYREYTGEMPSFLLDDNGEL